MVNSRMHGESLCEMIFFYDDGKLTTRSGKFASALLFNNSWNRGQNKKIQLRVFDKYLRDIIAGIYCREVIIKLTNIKTKI